MLTKERKKQLDTDLWIIVGVSLLVLVIYTVFGREIDNIAVDTEIPIVLRVLFMGGIFQFGIAGLGITIVAIVRKERFSDHGLTRKHLLPAIALSALCCVPDLLYNLFAGNVHTWLPFSAVQTTAEALESGFPENALAMLLTALFYLPDHWRLRQERRISRPASCTHTVYGCWWTGTTAFSWTGCCLPTSSASVCRERSTWTRRITRRSIM